MNHEDDDPFESSPGSQKLKKNKKSTSISTSQRLKKEGKTQGGSNKSTTTNSRVTSAKQKKSKNIQKTES